MSWLNAICKWIHNNLFKQSRRDVTPSYQNVLTNNTTVTLLYKNMTEAGDNKYTAFWLVNTFTRQYSDWSR